MSSMVGINNKYQTNVAEIRWGVGGKKHRKNSQLNLAYIVQNSFPLFIYNWSRAKHGIFSWALVCKYIIL